MAVMHGLPKLTSFSEKADTWADPIGLGPTVSLALAVAAELGCSLLVMLGFKTRMSVIPLIFTMVVAAFIVHAEDPFQKKELALLYLGAFIVILEAGPGRFSVDGLFSKKSPKAKSR